MSKHTPGPWVALKYDGRECGVSIIASNDPDKVSNPSRGQVAWATAILNTDARKAEANARLIAAAPDLYEALDDLMTALAHLVFSPPDALLEEMKAAEAALDKAQGTDS